MTWLIDLGFDICLDIHHPLRAKYPELDECATWEDIVFELRRIFLAQAA